MTKRTIRNTMYKSTLMPLESIYSENVKTMDTDFRSEDGAGSDEEGAVDAGNPFEIAKEAPRLNSRLEIKSFPLTSKFHENRMSFKLR